MLVRESDVGRLARWGAELLGPLTATERGPDRTVLRDERSRTFALTPGAGGSDFTFVRIGPRDGCPFASDVELARAAFAALAVEARCALDVEDRVEPPSRWWSVSGNGERPVDWRPPADLVDEERFGALLDAVGARRRAGLLAQLADRYREPRRAYHTLLHLSEAFGALSECARHLERRAEAELALWFHDAVYDTRREDNEESSAAWARDELLAGGAAADVAERVHALVRATSHRDVPLSGDARLVVDADLAILASAPDRFAAYERQIRREYDWVPEPEFLAGRRRFLEGMLGRPSIFSHPVMRERHEAHARRNVEAALAASEPGGSPG